MTFLAKYRGACVDCDDGVNPGEEVQYRGEGDDRVLAHVTCPEARVETVVPACPKCWLMHPDGACDL
ncbi:MAG: 66, gp66 [Rhodoglobus sp.]|nr:66, gp66 [Rhodoglobus sp.]